MSFKPIVFRSANAYDTNLVSDQTALDDFEPTLTVQAEKDNCDINVILERFGQGVPPPMITVPPADVEWNDALDFQSSMNLIVQAREAFMEVPAKIRARFHNDPQEYLEFIYNDDNYDEAVKLGIIPKPVESEGSVVEPSESTGSTSDSASV